MDFIFKLILVAEMCVITCNDRPEIINECPNTIPNDNGKNQDRILLPNNQTRLCCLCNKGQCMEQECNASDKASTICEPCPLGTFMNEAAHSYQKCKKNVNIPCDDNEILEYSLTFAPRCICKNGTYRTVKEGCVEWTKCSAGYGAKDPGTAFSDVVCEKCAEGFESSQLSSTEKCTQKIPTNASNTTHPETSHCSCPTTCPTTGVVVGIVIILVLLYPILIFIGIKCGCLTWNGFKKQRRQKNRKDSPNVSGKDNDIESVEDDEMLDKFKVESENGASNQG